MTRKKPETGLCLFRAIAAVALWAVMVFPFTARVSAAESMSQTIESYFSELKGDCSALARSPAMVVKGQSKELSGHFKRLIQQHQPLTALMKTDPAGVVAVKYARNEKTSKKKLSVAKQPFFQQPRKSLKEFDCLLKDDNGRYYLYWSKPVFRTVKSKRRFDGVVIAKVDLWDCFHKIASKTSEAFLIRLGTTTLYGHLWENKRIFVEDELIIAGIDKISVRYQKTGVSVVAQAQETQNSLAPPTAGQGASALAQPSSQPPAPETPAAQPEEKPKKNTVPIIIILTIVIIVVLTMLIMQLVKGLRPARRARFSGKDDHFHIR